MAVSTSNCDFGWKAPKFKLPGVDDHFHDLDDLKGENGTVVVFMCNHCPYVLAIVKNLIRDANDLQKIGISLIGINANDARAYPDDSFENMKKIAQKEQYPFPYLWDETQEIAHAYNAQCTPDFFGFNSDLELQYRGRLDASRANQTNGDSHRDLYRYPRVNPWFLWLRHSLRSQLQLLTELS